MVAADLARRGGVGVDDGGTALVLDPTLVDLAVVPAGGSAEGVAVDCRGIGPGLLLAPDGDDRVPDRRRGHRRRRARDRSPARSGT